jgi:hypothetical protein
MERERERERETVRFFVPISLNTCVEGVSTSQDVIKGKFIVFAFLHRDMADAVVPFGSL